MDGRTDRQTDRITTTKTVQRRASYGNQEVADALLIGAKSMTLDDLERPLQGRMNRWLERGSAPPPPFEIRGTCYVWPFHFWHPKLLHCVALVPLDGFGVRNFGSVHRITLLSWSLNMYRRLLTDLTDCLKTLINKCKLFSNIVVFLSRARLEDTRTLKEYVSIRTYLSKNRIRVWYVSYAEFGSPRFIRNVRLPVYSPVDVQSTRNKFCTNK